MMCHIFTWTYVRLSSTRNPQRERLSGAETKAARLEAELTRERQENVVLRAKAKDGGCILQRSTAFMLSYRTWWSALVHVCMHAC